VPPDGWFVFHAPIPIEDQPLSQVLKIGYSLHVGDAYPVAFGVVDRRNYVYYRYNNYVQTTAAPDGGGGNRLLDSVIRRLHGMGY
jgi:hypothetical protein